MNPSIYEYECSHVSDPNEIPWGNITELTMSENTMGGQTGLLTKVKACWSVSGVHFRFECEDEYTVSRFTSRDDPLCREDVVEIFIDETGSGTNYKEIEVSPNNVVFDALIENDLAGNIRVDKTWDAAGMTTIVQQTAEKIRAYNIFIPVDVFDQSIKSGSCWRVNFYRIDLDRMGKREFMAWSPTLNKSFHIPTNFGYFRFSGKGVEIRKRIGVIGLFHETNTFAPFKTDLHAFKQVKAQSPEVFFAEHTGLQTTLGGAIAASLDNKLELVPGLIASAMAGGMVTKAAAEALLTGMMASIALDLDGLLVILHGAMVSEQCPDMESEILRRIRQVVGPNLPLAITLDLHANIGGATVEQADIIVGYDTYPHVDMYDRSYEAVQLLVGMIHGEIKPTKALSEPRLLIVPQVMSTSEGAMNLLMKLAFEIERRPKVLNVTVLGGFPYSDVPDAGMAFVVTTDRNPELADQYAEELSALAWELRERFTINGISPEAAVAEALKLQEGPVILVEGSDNVGGGAPADATHLLKQLAHAPCRSLMMICDGEAARLAHNIGVGGAFSAWIGGKSDRQHGDPVQIKGIIHMLSDGKYRHKGPFKTGAQADMGLTAVIVAGLLTVILTENREPPWDIGHMHTVGLMPEDFHIIAVKSAVAWKTAFGQLAKADISVDSPGCCSFNLRHFTYKSLRHPLYPLDPVVD